ncbi:RagB/SusD family nutrient uptake outer membrane protein [Chryseobacterium sp. 'Rf worker isolate 10']|uniref:RagB/SusD family nutrient uptake outer membrane protein n=1 Tax=Chryseobacterium sp. 'Rf worker isolate 10' TaxID=2887348 RepID=UPI003D6EDAB3
MEIIKFISIAITMFLLTICISCEKLIEVDVPDNQIPSVEVFENVQTADAALAALYAGMRDKSPVAGDNSGTLLGIYTDDLDFYANAGSNGRFDLYRNQHIATNTDIYSYWTSAYGQIYVANAIIEGVEHSSSLPSADKNRIKGEALVMRSVIFFYLWQVFGDIPYPISTNYKINQSLTRTPALEAAIKLEGDLNEAVGLLHDEYRNAERIYPNKKVAQLMLAKIYMFQKRWSEAEIILKSIVQSSLYQFQNDITKVFAKSSAHILWQLKPKSGFPTLESMAYYFTGAAPSTYALTQNLINTFSAGDLRRANWIALVTVGQNTWYRSDKYKNRSNDTTEYSIVFRLEEVYLLLAEALTRQNRITEGLPYVNATRLRAGLAPFTSSMTKEVMLTEILLENRREFFTEMGHRFLDLKRLDHLGDLITVKPYWKSYHGLWPLPQQELLLNPNLNPQNTGY